MEARKERFIERDHASAAAYVVGDFCWAAVSSLSEFCVILVLTEHKSIAENAAKRYADPHKAPRNSWYPQATVSRVEILEHSRVRLLPEITRDRFERVRKRCTKAHENLIQELMSASRKYGDPKYAPQQKRLDALRAKQDAAFNDMFRLLEVSPRDWRSGVPCHWVALELTFEDAVRPESEPLLFTPPKAFGYLQAKK